MRHSSILAVAAAAVLAAGAWTILPSAAEPAHQVPPPVLDETVAANAMSETAVLAGGCFWGVQGVFQHVKGVTGAVSGYTGGDKEHAIYEVVGSGATGHAESVRITFDPRQITFGRILQIYFAVAHDPTELNYQGPDHGTQYRSAIFPRNDQQAQGRQGLYRAARQGPCLRRADRHHHRARQGLLPGRGLSPGFPDAAPGLSLHRLQRSAEDREPQDDVSGMVPRQPGAGDGDQVTPFGVTPTKVGVHGTYNPGGSRLSPG